MPVSDGMRAHVEELLSPMEGVTIRRMFGMARAASSRTVWRSLRFSMRNGVGMRSGLEGISSTPEPSRQRRIISPCEATLTRFSGSVRSSASSTRPEFEVICSPAPSSPKPVRFSTTVAA